MDVMDKGTFVFLPHVLEIIKVIQTHYSFRSVDSSYSGVLDKPDWLISEFKKRGPKHGMTTHNLNDRRDMYNCVLLLHTKQTPCSHEADALFVWLISHQPAVLFSRTTPTNQPPTTSNTFLSEQTSTSHKPNRQAESS
jgi:hypothetical protein